MVVQRAGGAVQLSSGIDERLGDKICALPGVHQVIGGLMDLVSFEKYDLIGVIVNGWGADCPVPERVEIVSGRRFGPADRRVVMLGRKLAADLGKQNGDSIELYGRKFQVIGIFQSFSVFENGAVFMPLAEMQCSSTGRIVSRGFSSFPTSRGCRGGRPVGTPHRSARSGPGSHADRRVRRQHQPDSRRSGRRLDHLGRRPVHGPDRHYEHHAHFGCRAHSRDRRSAGDRLEETARRANGGLRNHAAGVRRGRGGVRRRRAVVENSRPRAANRQRHRRAFADRGRRAGDDSSAGRRLDQRGVSRMVGNAAATG